MADFEVLSAVPISRIFLHLQNPRFEPVPTEDGAIAYLCNEENVYPLAVDIVENGLNPLERFALIPELSSGKTAKTNYIVAEGKLLPLE